MSSTEHIKREKEATAATRSRSKAGSWSGSGTGSRKGLSAEHKKQIIQRRLRTALK